MHNKRVGELSQLTERVEMLQLPLLQTLDDVDQCKAQTVDGHVLPKPSMVASREWTLNLAGVPTLNMAGLVIYLMDVCNWKDDAVRHDHQSSGC